jgi:FdhE protein
LTKNIIPEDYIKLQQAFIDEQKNWKTKFSSLKISHNSNYGNTKLPMIHQIDWSCDKEEIFACVKGMLELLKVHSTQFANSIEKIEAEVNEEMATEWVQQAIAINESYFAKVATDYEFESWIPAFVAENAAKPILQLIAEIEKEQIANNDKIGGCPCCGEPARLAEVDKNKKKIMLCPRCHTSWGVMKLECAYCGSTDHKNVRLIDVGEDGVEQIHICSSCNNYTKIVSTGRMIKKFDPAMLDLNSIHLDYIAQQQLVTESESEKVN